MEHKLVFMLSRSTIFTLYVPHRFILQVNLLVEYILPKNAFFTLYSVIIVKISPATVLL